MIVRYVMSAVPPVGVKVVRTLTRSSGLLAESLAVKYPGVRSLLYRREPTLEEAEIKAYRAAGMLAFLPYAGTAGLLVYSRRRGPCRDRPGPGPRQRAGSYTLISRTDAATRRAQRSGKLRMILTTKFKPVGAALRTRVQTVTLPALGRATRVSPARRGSPCQWVPSCWARSD